MCRIYIHSSGQAFNFKNDGIAYAPNSWYDSSSIRFKKDIISIDLKGVSDSIDNLRPVFYKYKEAHNSSDKEYIGLIAEEVAEVFPEVVEYDEDGIPCAIAYSRLSVIAIAEIKSLRERLLNLERRFDELSRHDD